jgi:hypothetical protein
VTTKNIKNRHYMSTQKQETIVLEVLRVASPDVLGQSKSLSVAVPFCFSNAKGDLKKVDNYADIQKMAAESAASFKANIKA